MCVLTVGQTGCSRRARSTACRSGATTRTCGSLRRVRSSFAPTYKHLVLIERLVGREVGAVSDARWAHFVGTRDEIARATELLQNYVLSPHVSRLSLDIDIERTIPVLTSSRSGLGEARRDSPT